MDLGDEDLFAVFDNESSSKSKRSAVASDSFKDEDDEKPGRPVKFDAGSLAVEISGSGKRTGSDTDEPVKKMKKDDRTIMTGLTDQDVDQQINPELVEHSKETIVLHSFKKIFSCAEF